MELIESKLDGDNSYMILETKRSKTTMKLLLDEFSYREVLKQLRFLTYSHEVVKISSSSSNQNLARYLWLTYHDKGTYKFRIGQYNNNKFDFRMKNIGEI